MNYLIYPKDIYKIRIYNISTKEYLINIFILMDL